MFSRDLTCCAAQWFLTIARMDPKNCMESLLILFPGSCCDLENPKLSKFYFGFHDSRTSGADIFAFSLSGQLHSTAVHN
jgi:hypothetical protein